MHALALGWKKFAGFLLAWGPFGLLFLAVLDSAGLPIVGGVDVLLVTFSAAHPQQAYIGAACAVAGSVFGTAILFFIARKGGEVLLAKHLSKRRGARLHAFFQRYGLATVFIPAVCPLPLPTKVPVFCAGALQVRTYYFIVVVLAARVIRYFALALLGQKLGPRTFSFLLSHLLVVAAIAIGLAVLFGFAIWFIDTYEIPEKKNHSNVK